ncbi:MAG: hypothetical protein OHK0050_23490 [Roseiflexaceae bacterium]
MSRHSEGAPATEESLPTSERFLAALGMTRGGARNEGHAVTLRTVVGSCVVWAGGSMRRCFDPAERQMLKGYATR